jgi:hypothetical protein
MLWLRNIFLGLMLAVLATVPGQARAQILVSFYSHDLGSTFPHAFFTLTGTPNRGGAAVSTNFGFTAKSLTPAILMGSVVGEVETLSSKYVESSDRQFTVKISDAQYDALLALIDKWRKTGGKSYNLNRRNCIHFVGEAAQLLGLKVNINSQNVKKPRAFMLSLIALNPWVKGPN